MLTCLLVGLGTAAVPGCGNNDAELARVEAEKAKTEALLAKAQAEVALAKAEAERAQAQKVAEAAREVDGATHPTGPGNPDPNLKGSPTAAPSPQMHEVEATVTLTVQERKSDGTPWDAMGGAPDILIMLTSPSTTVQSAVAQDRYSGQFGFPALQLTKGDALRVTVVDKDAVQSDPVGSAVVTFTGPGTSVAISGGSMNGQIHWSQGIKPARTE